jgi:glycerol-3-phosphate dehydrogenase
MSWVPLPWCTSQSTIATFSPAAASLAAPTAALLKRQKPIARSRTAWCPGGRPAPRTPRRTHRRAANRSRPAPHPPRGGPCPTNRGSPTCRGSSCPPPARQNASTAATYASSWTSARSSGAASSGTLHAAASCNPASSIPASAASSRPLCSGVPGGRGVLVQLRRGEHHQRAQSSPPACHVRCRSRPIGAGSPRAWVRPGAVDGPSCVPGEPPVPSRRPRRVARSCESVRWSPMAEGARFQRAAMLRRLADEEFDVLVVGGGITGCGVALDAASRGLRTALVERDDFASGHVVEELQAGARRLALPPAGATCGSSTRRCASGNDCCATRPTSSRSCRSSSPCSPRTGRSRRRSRRPCAPRSGCTTSPVAHASGSCTAGSTPTLRSRRAPRCPPIGSRRGSSTTTPVPTTPGSRWRSPAPRRVTAPWWRTAARWSSSPTTPTVGSRASIVEPAGDGARCTVRAKVVVSAAGVWADAVQRLADPAHASTLRPAKGVPHHDPVAPRAQPHRGDRLGAEGQAQPVPRAVAAATRRHVRALLRGHHRHRPTTATSTTRRPTTSTSATCCGALNHSLTSTVTADDVTGVWGGPCGRSCGPAPGGPRICRGAPPGRRGAERARPPSPAGSSPTYREMAEDAVDVALQALGRRERCRTRRLRLVGADGHRRVDRDHPDPDHPDRDHPDRHLAARYGSEAVEVLSLVALEPHARRTAGARTRLPPRRGRVRGAVTRWRPRSSTCSHRPHRAHTLQDRSATLAAAPSVAALLAGELGCGTDAEVDAPAWPPTGRCARRSRPPRSAAS